VNLDAGAIDSALADSRASLATSRFPVAHGTYGDALLVKAGLAMRNGGATAAAPHIEAYFQSRPQPPEYLLGLAGNPATFPVVYALLTPQLKPNGGAEEAARVIGAAARFITPTDLKKLHALGLSFDYADEVNGTLLHQAIETNNVETVRTLLALGADATQPLPNGITTLQWATPGTSPERKQIRQLLLAKLGTPPFWEDPSIELPVAGRWYRLERKIGVAEDATSKPYNTGMTLLAGRQCRKLGKPYYCFSFYTAPEKYYGTLLVPASRLSDFAALREVAGPE
jgi:ankyrin repeat protein